MTNRTLRLSLLATCLLAACVSGDSSIAEDPLPDAAAAPQPDAATPTTPPEPLDCEPPNMLIVLDRTMSMHRRPDGVPAADTPAGHQTSKWWIAIDAVEALVADLDGTIRFGLELFPRDPGGTACVTLSQRIQGNTATNTDCEAGEILVDADVATADPIRDALDPETTRLCTSTPIGAGLGTALAAVLGFDDADRDTHVLLITDGRDTCSDTLSLQNAQLIANAGARVYVVGFDGTSDGIDSAHLNDLACAGRTAIDFDTHCVDAGAGNYVAADSSAPALYLRTEDRAALGQALESIAGEICCGCVE